MDREVRARIKWVITYKEAGDAGLTCRRCGMSRPTLRKWWRRYNAEGLDGLRSRSRLPKSSPQQRVFAGQEAWIRNLSQNRRLGVRRIQSEPRWTHNFDLSLATIHKVLKRINAKPLKRKRWRKKTKRYQKDLLGEQIQMDSCRVAPGIIQFTAVDDCARFMFARVFSRRRSANAVAFLEWVIGQTKFPIQHIQTDRGTEFTAHKFVDMLIENQVKRCPIKAVSPHLNGKVERLQRTVLDE